ncbi:MAG: hypothetical protein WAV76_10795 [Bacteroidota bacterium]
MKKIIIIVLLLLPCAAKSQYRMESVQASPGSNALTGNFNIDFYASSIEHTQLTGDSIQTDMPKPYSPLTAGLLSAVVPGAGQLYTQSYWQSITTFSVEVAMWIVYAVYYAKGNRETNNFQTYADQNWSVVEYVNWIKATFPSIDISGVITSTNINLLKQTPWLCVNWSKLNAIEETLADYATTGVYNGFTHQLPPRPDQQYYELIGKYPQFIGGWDDAWNGSIPLYSDADVLASKVSANFLFYRNMRGQANSYYAVASTASYILIANHVLSALEAAWNAAHLNHQMQMHASILPRVLPDGYVEYVPSFSLAVEF